MGAYFSKDAKDFQLLARDPRGGLHMYTMDNIDLLDDCNPLPFKMEENVRYAFLSTNDKGRSAHVYKDRICDITGNEPVTKSMIQNKKSNTINYSSVSNSNYFTMNSDAENTPDFGIFINKAGDRQFAAKSSFTKCIPMPIHSSHSFSGEPDNISYNHNNVAMSFFSDVQCTNEYISVIPGIPDKKYTDTRQYNIDNKATLSEKFDLPYTPIKARKYSDPAAKTNAMYYQSYRQGYPQPQNNKLP